MRIAFNSPLPLSAKWASILKKLHEEYMEEELEIPFKKWVYDRYEIQLIFSAMPIAKPGIVSIDVPDDAVTYLQLRFS